MNEEKKPTVADIVRQTVKELSGKGGKETMSDFCPTCGTSKEYRHLVTDLGIEKDRHQHDIEKLAAEQDSAKQQYESANAKLADALKSLQHHILHYPNGCQDGEDCPTNQALHRIAQDAKKNLTPDDLNINLIGEFFKKRGILGVAKTEKGGEYKPFKSIERGDSKNAAEKKSGWRASWADK